MCLAQTYYLFLLNTFRALLNRILRANTLTKSANETSYSRANLFMIVISRRSLFSLIGRNFPCLCNNIAPITMVIGLIDKKLFFIHIVRAKSQKVVPM